MQSLLILMGHLEYGYADPHADGVFNHAPTGFKQLHKYFLGFNRVGCLHEDGLIPNGLKLSLSEGIFAKRG